jgi:hypothetical protein
MVVPVLTYMYSPGNLMLATKDKIRPELIEMSFLKFVAGVTLRNDNIRRSSGFLGPTKPSIQ